MNLVVAGLGGEPKFRISKVEGATAFLWFSADTADLRHTHLLPVEGVPRSSDQIGSRFPQFAAFLQSAHREERGLRVELSS